MMDFLTQMLHEARFHLSRYINAQNNMYWCSINPGQTSEVPLHEQMTGVWYAITATSTEGLTVCDIFTITLLVIIRIISHLM